VTASGRASFAQNAAAKQRTVPERRRWPDDVLKRSYPGTTRRVLEQAPELTLYSTHPSPLTPFDPDFNDKRLEQFHEHRVLGKTVVRGEEKRRVLDALFSFYVYPDRARNGRIAARCFMPRHGIRARDAATGRTVDLLVCFSCNNARIYASDGTDEDFTAFDMPLREEFERLFRERGIPVAP
jgi:hypothetical protein